MYSVLYILEQNLMWHRFFKDLVNQSTSWRNSPSWIRTRALSRNWPGRSSTRSDTGCSGSRCSVWLSQKQYCGSAVLTKRWSVELWTTSRLSGQLGQLSKPYNGVTALRSHRSEVMTLWHIKNYQVSMVKGYDFVTISKLSRQLGHDLVRVRCWSWLILGLNVDEWYF